MSSPFDLDRYKWREVTPSGESYLVHHGYTILGHDAAAGTLDMLVRWGNDGVLYEILDDNLDPIYPITIDLLVADFNLFAR